MPSVKAPAHQAGDFLVDYEEKYFPMCKQNRAKKRSSHFIPSTAFVRPLYLNC
jgi:hypothetical protein